jgi:Rrf2 family protein
MKLITRDTDYAIRAISYIARSKNKIITTANLTKAIKIPRPFLRKILQVLNKKGILVSYKGQGGGFLLAKPTNKIFLTDLMQIFQGPLCLNECLFKKKVCPNINFCLLRKKIRMIEKFVFLQLRPITLADLLNKKG